MHACTSRSTDSLLHVTRVYVLCRTVCETLSFRSSNIQSLSSWVEHDPALCVSSLRCTSLPRNSFLSFFLPSFLPPHRCLVSAHYLKTAQAHTRHSILVAHFHSIHTPISLSTLSSSTKPVLFAALHCAILRIPPPYISITVTVIHV